MLKLSRKQELKLIDLGLQKLLESLITESTKIHKDKSNKSWSPRQRRKFRTTMKKVWAEKRKNIIK